MRRSPRSDDLTLALLGFAIAVPVLYYGIQVVAAPFYPDFSVVRTIASELGTDRSTHPWVFNGGVFRYDPVHSKAGGAFLEAKPGERVRFYFVNAGPNNVSAVHPIAEIWDDVWESGNPANHTRGVQTQLIPPAGAAILDMVLDGNDGVYPIVTHSLTDALRGAIALLKVDKDAKPLPLMPLVEPAK